MSITRFQILKSSLRKTSETARKFSLCPDLYRWENGNNHKIENIRESSSSTRSLSVGLSKNEKYFYDIKMLGGALILFHIPNNATNELEFNRPFRDTKNVFGINKPFPECKLNFDVATSL